MNDEVQLDPPRVVRRGGFLIAGLRRHYTLARDLSSIMQDVSKQWHGFRPRKREVRRAINQNTYGVCFRIFEGDAGFDYMCGMEVPDAKDLPEDFSTLAIPPLTYAVFRHKGASSALPTVYFTIFGKALPDAGLEVADRSSGAPEFFEYFDRAYDTKTETGGPEIYVPLKGAL